MRRAGEPPGGERLPGDLDAELTRLLDDDRADAAAHARTRERWLRRQAEEDARFVAVLLDLAERRVPVTLRSTSGRSYHGHVDAVGADHATLVTPAGLEHHVHLDALAAVRPQPGWRPGDTADDRRPRTDRRLLDRLAEVAPERPRVALVVAGIDETLAGELRSVGADVVTVLLEGDGAGPCYVRSASVTELCFLGSG